MLFLDLDRFKEINDTHGHHVGDAVLTEVARRLTRSVRESDSIARLGGDEFVVLLDKVSGREDCLAAAVNIERALAENSSFYGLTVDITASIGQALFPDDGEDEDEGARVFESTEQAHRFDLVPSNGRPHEEEDQGECEDGHHHPESPNP